MFPARAVLGVFILFAVGWTGGLSAHLDAQASFRIQAEHAPPCPPADALLVLRVAIIGAGASGASTAYFLDKARKQLKTEGIPGCQHQFIPEAMHISLYERNERVGGRALAVHPLDDARIAPIDIGANVVADSDQNMVEAMYAFGLARAKTNRRLQRPQGLWDGEKFVIEDFDASRWGQLKLYWRYRNCPQRLQTLMQKAMHAFEWVYSPRYLHKRPKAHGYPWPSVRAMAEHLDPHGLSSQTAKTYLESHKVSSICADELANAATRANYGQDVKRIHAFGGMISLHANGASGIQGGNAQVFQHMLTESNATVHMGAAGDVTGIMKVQSKTVPHAPLATRWRVGTRDGHGEVFDVVVIATPWHHSDITLLNTDKVVPNAEFQKIWVTLVATTASQPSPGYFGYKRSSSHIPRTIFTTHPEQSDHEPDFLLLAYLRTLTKPYYHRQWERLYLVKLVSYGPLSQGKLDVIFGEGTVVWSYKQDWHAFPKLPPTHTLPSFEVDTDLYNVNAMEQWVSTMESSTVAAKNVAALILQNWLGTRFIHGKDCSYSTRPPNPAKQWNTWGCYST